MKVEIKNISVTSLILSSLPVVIFVTALLGGTVTFLIVPDTQFSPMTLSAKLQAIGIFSVIYVLLATAFLVFLAFIYNIFSGVIGLKGVRVDMEEVAED